MKSIGAFSRFVNRNERLGTRYCPTLWTGDMNSRFQISVSCQQFLDAARFPRAQSYIVRFRHSSVDSVESDNLVYDFGYSPMNRSHDNIFEGKSWFNCLKDNPTSENGKKSCLISGRIWRIQDAESANHTQTNKASFLKEFSEKIKRDKRQGYFQSKCSVSKLVNWHMIF